MAALVTHLQDKTPIVSHYNRILKSYGEVDEIPAEMLKSSLSEQIDSVLGKLDDLLKK